jgi:hypothetical protein
VADISFDSLCEQLATYRGGYTLWFGAGAAKALCASAPTWAELVERLLGTLTPPPNWEGLDYSSRLEWLSGKHGHDAFRKELRAHIVDKMVSATFDEDVARAQAVIGLRAGALVSFNIETVSAAPFACGRGGAMLFRPYLARTDQLGFEFTGLEGVVSSPVFFPHGLLDAYGQCVMTKSEYALHGMSLAVRTAIALCLGGDLVIVGMSLSDDYLRQGILENRKWLRSVFWIASSFEHVEWARVANVHCVRAEHSRMWTAMREAHLQHDTGTIKKWMDHSDMDQRAVDAVTKIRTMISSVPSVFDDLAKTYVGTPTFAPSDLQRFARDCADLGIAVPTSVLTDPRYGAPSQSLRI